MAENTAPMNTVSLGDKDNTVPPATKYVGIDKRMAKAAVTR